MTLIAHDHAVADHVAANDNRMAHEKLDVYQAAREFLAVAYRVARRLPRQKGQLGDQLTRAAEGVVLRIAEGAGCEWKSPDQKRYFRSARGSAMESAAVLDVCRLKGGFDGHDLEVGHALLVRIVKMLSRMAQPL